MQLWKWEWQWWRAECWLYRYQSRDTKARPNCLSRDTIHLWGKQWMAFRYWVFEALSFGPGRTKNNVYISNGFTFFCHIHHLLPSCWVKWYIFVFILFKKTLFNFTNGKLGECNGQQHSNLSFSSVLIQFPLSIPLNHARSSWLHRLFIYMKLYSSSIQAEFLLIRNTDNQTRT